MAIQKDAGEILTYLYNQYLKDNQVFLKQDLMTTTNWNKNRLYRAVKYLKDKRMIDTDFCLDMDFVIKGILPSAIDTIEDPKKKKFENEFGFKINLGVFEFSLSKKER